MVLDPEQRKLEGLRAAADVLKQMLTLASGSLVLSASIFGLFAKEKQVSDTWLLWVIWGAMLGSIGCGLVGLGVYASKLADASKDLDPERWDIRVPAMLQQVLLVVGFAALSLFGVLNL